MTKQDNLTKSQRTKLLKMKNLLEDWFDGEPKARRKCGKIPLAFMQSAAAVYNKLVNSENHSAYAGNSDVAELFGKMGFTVIPPHEGDYWTLVNYTIICE